MPTFKYDCVRKTSLSSKSLWDWVVSFFPYYKKKKSPEFYLNQKHKHFLYRVQKLSIFKASSLVQITHKLYIKKLMRQMRIGACVAPPTYHRRYKDRIYRIILTFRTRTSKKPNNLKAQSLGASPTERSIFIPFPRAYWKLKIRIFRLRNK